MFLQVSWRKLPLFDAEGGASPPVDASPPEAPAATPVPAAVEPSAGVAAEGDSGNVPPPLEVPKAPAQDWREKRIAKLTAQLAEARRQADAAAAKAAQTNPAAEAGLRPGTPEFEATIAREAEARLFAQRCNEVATSGRLAFKDFDQKIMQLVEVAELGTSQGQQKYNQFLAAVLETGTPEKVLYELGNDPEEAERLLGLPPAKMGIELGRRMAAGAGVPAVSGAPKPVTPIGGRGGAHEAIDPADPTRADHLSKVEWMRRRNEQVKARRAG